MIILFSSKFLPKNIVNLAILITTCGGLLSNVKRRRICWQRLAQRYFQEAVFVDRAEHLVKTCGHADAAIDLRGGGGVFFSRRTR